MERKNLVTYATKSGATQEIAEVVTAALRERGLEVDLKPIRSVKSLERYSAVVIGAPFYMFHWHKDAPGFLKRFRKTLESGLPAAVFGGGPFGPAAEKDWQGVRDQMEKELAKFPWFKPVSVQIVGGRFDPARLSFPYNLIPAMKAMEPSDLRNWDEIRAWADGLEIG